MGDTDYAVFVMLNIFIILMVPRTLWTLSADPECVNSFFEQCAKMNLVKYEERRAAVRKNVKRILILNAMFIPASFLLGCNMFNMMKAQRPDIGKWKRYE